MSSHSYSESSEGGGPSAGLKLYRSLIFSIPIFLAFVLLFLLYLFYLHRRSMNLSSVRMRAPFHLRAEDGITRCELGLRKEHREMLPIIVFKESFSVKDTQCPVCLADYQPGDRLQQIPACAHTFHMGCIDLWLATQATCPLCRLSLVASSKASDPSTHSPEASQVSSSTDGNYEEATSRVPRNGEERRGGAQSDDCPL